MLERLRALSEPKYRDFALALLPGVTHMLGVRLPALRVLAREIARGDWRAFADRGAGMWFEERMLKGLVLGYAAMPDDERKKRLWSFASEIDNWSVCDSCAATCRFMRENREMWRDFLWTMLTDRRPFAARLALACLINHFMEAAFEPDLIAAARVPEPGRYYVDMAAAWLIAETTVRFGESALNGDGLCEGTRRMAIRKICESGKAPADLKARARALIGN